MSLYHLLTNPPLFTSREYPTYNWNINRHNRVPDSEAFDIELTADEATIEFTGHIAHPITLAIKFTSPAWDDDSTESYYQQNEVFAETTLDADNGTNHTTHRVTLDTSHVDFPKNINVDAHLIAEDQRLSQPGDDDRYFWMLAPHCAVPIQHDEGVRWINHSSLSPTSNTVGDTPNYTGHDDYHTQDDDGTTTRTFACIRHNPTTMFGVAIETNNTEMRNYGQNGEQGLTHIFREADDAPQHPTISKLAQDLWDIHTALGITGIYNRLRSTAKFVQSFPYDAQNPNSGKRKPLYRIHTHGADCTVKTALYGAILRCQPYDIRITGVSCELIGQGGHLIGGIDMTHIQDSNHDLSDLYTMNQDDLVDHQGIPDHEYAFIDLTDRSNSIGEYDSDSYELHAFWFTNRGEGQNM